jgi:hypothetical protein
MKKRTVKFEGISAFIQSGISLVTDFIKKWFLPFNQPRAPNRSNIIINVISIIIVMSLAVSLSDKARKGNHIGDEMYSNEAEASAMYPGATGYYSFAAAIALPGDGAMFAAPANITIYASAINVGGYVTKLDFYANSELLYSSGYSNYAFTWKGAPAGQYVLTVRATNDKGKTIMSLPARITVIDTTATGCVCAAGCSDRVDIAPPFSIDGTGEYCWEATSLGAYVYSINVDTLLINGADMGNCWTNRLPPKVNDRYFIYYKSSNEEGHFEMK